MKRIDNQTWIWFFLGFVNFVVFVSIVNPFTREHFLSVLALFSGYCFGVAVTRFLFRMDFERKKEASK